MSKGEKSTGEAGENLVRSALQSLNIRMVERIATPVRLVPSKIDRGAFRVIWGEPVSGDFHGIIPGSGVSVLAEIKTILDRNLRYSDMRKHQPARLTEHAEYGGLSLLVWVHSSGIYVMDWRDVCRSGFGPRCSLDVETASGLQMGALNGARGS